jgi:hypothetical protein
MSKNRLVQENFDRFDLDKFGMKIPVYRKSVTYLTKVQTKERVKAEEESKVQALAEFKKRFPDAVTVK